MVCGDVGKPALLRGVAGGWIALAGLSEELRRDREVVQRSLRGVCQEGCDMVANPLDTVAN